MTRGYSIHILAVDMSTLEHMCPNCSIVIMYIKPDLQNLFEFIQILTCQKLSIYLIYQYLKL